MGMFNEVYHKCPDCGGDGYMQTPQVTLGFGHFRVDDPEDSSLDELNEEQLMELKSCIMNKRFECQKCGLSFNPFTKNSLMETRRRLFGKTDEHERDYETDH